MKKILAAILALLHSVENDFELKAMLQHTLTGRINERQLFMKGIDIS